MALVLEEIVVGVTVGWVVPALVGIIVKEAVVGE